MKVEINGLEEILQNLKSKIVDEKLESKALNKAGNITKKTIAEESPVLRGILKENIKLRKAKDGEAIVHTGRAFHAHLVEFGRSGGSAVTKGGKQVKWGPTSPNPFFSRGFEASANEAKQAIIDELRKGMGL